MASYDNFDDLLKAKIQEGQSIDPSDLSASDRDIEMLQKLINSNDWLLEAVISLQETLEKQNTFQSQNPQPTFQPISSQDFTNASTSTHDINDYMAQNIPGYITPQQREALRQNFKQTEEDLKRHLDEVKNIQSSGGSVNPGDVQDTHTKLQELQEKKQELDEQERKEQELANTFITQLKSIFGGAISVGGNIVNFGAGTTGSHLQNLQNMYTGQAVAQTAQVLGGGEVGGFVADLLPQLLTAGRNLSSMATSALGLSSAIGALIPAVVGTVAVMGTFNAMQFIGQRNEYQQDVLRLAPGTIGTLTDGSGLSPHDFMYKAKHNLITSRSDKQIETLVEGALGARPTKGTTQQEVQNQAFIMGYLQDIGLSPQKSQAALTTMQHSLSMTTEAATGQLVAISKTAAQHSLNLNDYVEKITQVTVSLRGLGVTVGEVNNTFESYMQRTLPNGQTLNANEAMQATQTELSMGRNISLGEAIYAASTTGSNIKVGPTLGLEGTGTQTLGDLSSQGGINSVLAGLYLKASNPAQSFAAIAQRQLKNIQNFYPSVAGNTDAQKVLLADEMKRKGLIQGDISDPATAAVLDKIIKMQGETPEKVAKDLGKEIERMMPKPMDKVIEELGRVFGEEFTKSRKEIQGELERFKAWEDLWEDINNMLGATFLPIVLRITAELGAIGEGIHAFASSGGNFGKASEAWQHSRKEWAEQIKNITDSKDVQEYLKNSPVSDFMLNMTSMEENKQKAQQDFLGSVLGMSVPGGVGGMGAFSFGSAIAAGMTSPISGSQSTVLSSLSGKETGSGAHGSLYNNNALNFRNLGFHTKDKMNLGQAAFLTTLNDSKLPFKAQIFGLETQHGHSDGRGGEHKTGNAVDISISELSHEQIVQLGRALSSNPYVDKVGVTFGGGRESGINFNKLRNLPGHKDHFHVTLKPGASKDVAQSIAMQSQISNTQGGVFGYAANSSLRGAGLGHLVPQPTKVVKVESEVTVKDDGHKNKKVERKIPKQQLQTGTKH